MGISKKKFNNLQKQVNVGFRGFEGDTHRIEKQVDGFAGTLQNALNPPERNEISLQQSHGQLYVSVSYINAALFVGLMALAVAAFSFLCLSLSTKVPRARRIRAWNFGSTAIGVLAYATMFAQLAEHPEGEGSLAQIGTIRRFASVLFIPMVLFNTAFASGAANAEVVLFCGAILATCNMVGADLFTDSQYSKWGFFVFGVGMFLVLTLGAELVPGRASQAGRGAAVLVLASLLSYELLWALGETGCHAITEPAQVIATVVVDVAFLAVAGCILPVDQDAPAAPAVGPQPSNTVPPSKKN